ncbi:MAG: hypothetical protein LH468_09895 [Nocardioides sp.]|nr:hypothetical protein [Nocardioides sp.]
MTTVLVWLVLVAVLAPGVLAVREMEPGNGGRRIHATGQEIEVGFRPHRPLVIAVAGLALGGALASTALATSGAVSVLCWLLALLPVAALVGAVGTLRRRPRVLLTAEGLDYRGWGVDACVAWDDVEGTVADARSELRPLAEILVRPGGSSFRHRAAVLALPEPLGRRPAIRMLAGDLDHPWLLLEYADRMARLPADQRPGRLGADGLDFLDGSPRAH